MHIDTDIPAPAHKSRLSVATRLHDALMALADGHASILRHAERNWASITFAGTRHTLDLGFEGPDAVEAAERLIDALPEHEFALPHQFVADATILSVEQTMLPEPSMKVSVELLLVEDL